MTLDERADYIFIRVCYLALPSLVAILIGIILLFIVFIWLWRRRHLFDALFNVPHTVKSTLMYSEGRLSIVSSKDYQLITKIRLEGKLYMIIGKQAYNGVLIKDAWEYVLQEWSE